MYNNIISNYTNGAYTFDTLIEANANGLVEPAYLSGLVRLMVNDVISEKRFNNKFAQFKKKRGYSGKIINSIYVNPATGKEFTVDGLTTLFDLAPADVKGSISKYTKPLQYDTTYNKDELMKAFTSEAELTAFLNKLIGALYNGAEIDDKNEFVNMINDLIENNLVVFDEVETVTSDAVKDLGIALKKYVAKFKEESDKYNVWKRVNPRDTHAIFWSNPEDINILLPISVWATLDVALYASLFHMEKAELESRVFTVDDDKLPDHVQAVIFDSRLIDIEEIYAELEPTFYDSTKRRYKDVYNVNNQYGINPFANCVVILDDIANVPEVEATAVRSQSVTVESGVAKEIVLDVVPVGANATITPVPGKSTTTAVASYDELTGWSMSITATASDTITFTVDGSAITGSITVTVAS